MLIKDVAPNDCLHLLASLHLGRLACAKDSQPYVRPFDFAYDNNYIYSFSTVGQAITWMRANPLVCVQTDQVASHEEWLSLIIFGRYEELPDTPEWESQRALAFQLLQARPIWWEPGYAKTVVRGVERPLIPVYFRIAITEITGLHAVADSGPAR
jgi:uncharacterized protein